MAERAGPDHQANRPRLGSTSGEVAPGGVTPVGNDPWWDTLQRSIGNQAVGRIVEGRHGPSPEGLTPTTPWKPREPEPGRGSQLEEGGFVQRAPVAADPPPPDLSGAGQPAAEERYSITMSTGVRDNLTKDQAIGLLHETSAAQQRALDQYSGEWAETNKARLSFFGAIGGALTDLAGKNFPSYEETWKDADNAMIEVRRLLRAKDVRAAGQQLKTAHDAYQKGNGKWSAYKAQLESAGTKAQIGIVVVAVVAVAIFVTGGAITAPGAAAAGGAGGVGAGGIAGGTAAAGGGTVVMGGAPTIAAGGGVAAGGGAAAGGGTVVMGAAPTIAASGTAAAGGGGAAVAGGGATVAGVTEGGIVAEGLAQQATGIAVRAVGSGGAAAGTAVAEGMGVWTLEAVMARLSAAIVVNGPLAPAEVQLLKRTFDIVNEVWKRKAGLPGGPP